MKAGFISAARDGRIWQNAEGQASMYTYIALVVVFIGALNWGLIGLFRLDLVRLIFGDMSLISRIVYVLVGICGLYLLTFFGRVKEQ